MKHKFLITAAILGAFSFGAPAPATAQHVAGGILVEYDNLSVAMISSGWSVLHMLRGSVYNEFSDFVGYVHDAIILPDGTTTYIIVNVAGFLDVGEKLVVLPVEAFGIKPNGDLYLPNATKANLKKLPRFRYTR